MFNVYLAAVCKSKKCINLPKVDHSNSEICFSISIIANPTFLYILSLALHKFQGQQYIESVFIIRVVKCYFFSLGSTSRNFSEVSPIQLGLLQCNETQCKLIQCRKQMTMHVCTTFPNICAEPVDKQQIE